jgi:hypothetical protein
VIDHATIGRALRRLVYTDKILSLAEARKYCAIVGLSEECLTQDPTMA